MPETFTPEERQKIFEKLTVLNDELQGRAFTIVPDGTALGVKEWDGLSGVVNEVIYQSGYEETHSGYVIRFSFLHWDDRQIWQDYGDWAVWIECAVFYG